MDRVRFESQLYCNRGPSTIVGVGDLLLLLAKIFGLERIRTADLLIANEALYQTKLRAHDILCARART